MEYPRDESGVLILGKPEVEHLSEEFLSEVAPECLRSPQFTPLASILEHLQGKGHLTFEPNQDLGVTEAGQKILGRYVISTKTIYVDSSLVAGNDIRYPFTVAHELGHFYLHGGIDPSAVGLGEDATIDDSAEDIAAHRIEKGNPRSFVEWQANRFAAGILVPRTTLEDALVAVQEAMDITRNVGRVWLDGTVSSRRDFATTKGALGEIYRVSMKVVSIRLSELDLLDGPVAGKAATRIGDVLKEMYEC